MCGISGIMGPGSSREAVSRMVESQHHRGPDASGVYFDPSARVGLGHNRLSIIDLSEAGRQPMADASGRYQIVFNGEIYNYAELRQELEAGYAFRTRTDTEVLLAAYARWGERCLDRLIGMFAFLIWDTQSSTLFGARDRFGVKPFHYAFTADGTLLISSEIKALHQAGLPRKPEPATWASYLTYGLYENAQRTFWQGVKTLPGGHYLTWDERGLAVRRWYDLAERVGEEFDERSEAAVAQEYLDLLKDSVRLRFRADVPVGINLSGGLDSSLLLGLVHAVQGGDSDVSAYTFITGDSNYDELPWVQAMLAATRHPLVPCQLRAEQVPELASDVQEHQDEPFGGLPTLAYSRVFEEARSRGTIVLLDGQGMDEQWAGYDYYAAPGGSAPASVVQGTRESPVRPECLLAEFRALAEPLAAAQPFSDRLRNLQYRDLHETKIPRGLRFNDRVSMRSSTELREPFLDHRLIELALKQRPDRKIRDGVRKWFPRQIARNLLPEKVAEAPKRPLQTPQREWLAGPLSGWAGEMIENAVNAAPHWLDAEAVRSEWQRYLNGANDNSFFVWQWISMGLMARDLQ